MPCISSSNHPRHAVPNGAVVAVAAAAADADAVGASALASVPADAITPSHAMVRAHCSAAGVSSTGRTTPAPWRATCPRRVRGE